MRDISKTKIEAITGGLSILQTIPDDQLEALAAVYETTLAAIREAIAAREAQRQHAEEIRARIVQARSDYRARCMLMARIARRRKLSAHALRRLAPEGSATVARDMLKTGRRLLRERKADAKRQAILDGYARGLGPRPLAREIAARFGACSPAYVCKVVKAEMQQPLPMRHLRVV